MDMCRSRTRRLYFSVRIILYSLLVWAACQPPTPSSTDAAESPLEVGEAGSITTVCYLHIHGRDSVKLRFTHDQDSIKGIMRFKNYQIDGSQGTVRGRFHGDTLFVLYDFFAEGTHNITEEAFFKSGNTYIRGFGEREHIRGVHRFIDRKSIDFSVGQVFLPASCVDGFADL